MTPKTRGMGSNDIIEAVAAHLDACSDNDDAGFPQIAIQACSCLVQDSWCSSQFDLRRGLASRPPLVINR